MLRKFFIYGIWWWLAALLDLLFLWFFTEIIGIFYLISAVIAFCLSLSFWYIFHKYITFDSAETKHMDDMTRFSIFQIIGLGINISMLLIFVSIFWYNYMLIACINKVIVFWWNFFMNYCFNFSAKWKYSQL